MEGAFQESKQQLAQAIMLAHPAERARLIPITDASDTAMGAALEQIVDGIRQSLGFFSRRFMLTQTRYSTYDRELFSDLYSGTLPIHDRG